MNENVEINAHFYEDILKNNTFLPKHLTKINIEVNQLFIGHMIFMKPLKDNNVLKQSAPSDTSSVAVCCSHVNVWCDTFITCTLYLGRVIDNNLITEFYILHRVLYFYYRFYLIKMMTPAGGRDVNCTNQISRMFSKWDLVNFGKHFTIIIAFTSLLSCYCCWCHCLFVLLMMLFHITLKLHLDIFLSLYWDTLI